MGKGKRAVIRVVVLATVCGLIVWHVIHWHSSGMYLEMSEWLQTGKGYITVLYNLGLMLVLGALLGFLMKEITGLVGYEIGGTKHEYEGKTDSNK